MSSELGYIAGAIPEMFLLFVIAVAILAELFATKCCKNENQ